MNETRKTIIFGGVAIGLALLAFLVNIPGSRTPEVFFDKGELFFPEFTDPNVATTLEVIQYKEDTGSPVPFKVTFKEGIWTIPSHHDYPADGKERLAKTAAGVINITKDDFRSDNSADHEAFGVIDPLDETNTSLKGRGERVTLKGASDQILADFIIGKKVEGHDKFRFVRIPGQKRVYAARMDIDISTTFSDWIEADLLKVAKSDIKQVTLKDYTIDERLRMVKQRDVIVLNKDGDDWTEKKMTDKQEVDKTKMNDLLKAVDELSIVGVRPKPPGLSDELKTINEGVSLTMEDQLSLKSKGYYLHQGQLLSNEGELQTRTKDGVIYTLRFGEIVYGAGLEVTAGTNDNDTQESGDTGENRYLFITTSFDASDFPEPQKPKNTDFQSKADSLWTDADRTNKKIFDKHEAWKKKIEKGQKLSDDLNTRFSKWYYVISSESFDKIHLKRNDLIKKKEDS
ncbi:MAG: DUF4340 domain-containing protein [bacterium]